MSHVARDKLLQERVGERIREQRVAKGLTQQELADAACIALSTLSRVERGRLSPSLGVLGRLAEALDLSLCHLFDLDGGAALASAYLYSDSSIRRVAKVLSGATPTAQIAAELIVEAVAGRAAREPHRCPACGGAIEDAG